MQIGRDDDNNMFASNLTVLRTLGNLIYNSPTTKMRHTNMT